MQDPPRYVLDETAIARAAEIERLRVFNARCISGAMSSAAGIALMGWVIWAGVGMERALSWAALMSVVEVAIAVTGLRCRKALDAGTGPASWANIHAALAGLVGVMWGSAVWFIGDEDGTLAYSAVLAILVGVAGVSMVTMASYVKASLAFFGGIYVVPLLHVTTLDSPVAVFLQVGLMVGLVVQLGYTRELRQIVLRDAEQMARNAALIARLHELVVHDPMTEAFSRRYTFEQMEQMVSTRQRHGSSASMVMFDLDHFKTINDTYGHPTGDRALREAVQAISAQLRDGDVLGRIGGEEFLVLLPMTEIQAAQQLAERLRLTLAQTSIEDGKHTIFLPASFGVAELQPAESHSEWFRRVDGALYLAKAQGRNRVVVAA